jgi:alpha-1,3/alpha-1,6-mannosyltransferase
MLLTNSIIKGGYDNRVQENVSYHKSLVQLAESLGLKTTTAKNVVTALGISDDIDALFLLSVPNTLKEMLLRSARLLVYTPSNEHFGIVPLEAMLAGTPVIATNTGGPLETVVPELTGWLCSPDDVEAWTEVMDTTLHKLSDAQRKRMGAAARARVRTEFSDSKMAERLDEIIMGIAGMPRQFSVGLILAVAAVPVVAMATVVALWKIYDTYVRA